MWRLFLRIFRLLFATMASIRQHLEKLASSMLSGKLQILSAPEKPGLAYGIAQIVDNVESLEHMLKSLSTAKQIALDSEGISLGRTGKLCLLSVAPAPAPDAPPEMPAPVFLLDVTSLSTLAFTHKPGQPLPPGRGSRSRSRGTAGAASSGSGCGNSNGLRCLKEMLECPSVTKLFYDVRCDAEALYHQHGVSLKGVVDLQLSEVAYRRYGPVVRRVGYVIGLSKALESYLAPELRERWQATAVDKRLLHETFERDPMYWDRRPLSQEQVRYAADDVLYLHHLHREFTGALTPPIFERVALFSQYRVEDSQHEVVPTKEGFTGAGGGGGRGGSDPTRALAPPGL